MPCRQAAIAALSMTVQEGLVSGEKQPQYTKTPDWVAGTFAALILVIPANRRCWCLPSPWGPVDSEIGRCEGHALAPNRVLWH